MGLNSVEPFTRHVDSLVRGDGVVNHNAHAYSAGRSSEMFLWRRDTRPLLACLLFRVTVP